ncbi:primosomal protein N' [Myxococcota bacterium]
MSFAKIAVPLPLGRSFTYSVPSPLQHAVCRGARVLVNFHHRQVLGVVVATHESRPELPPGKLKAIDAVVDPEPVLPEELLAFLEELARYYFAPIGEVLRLALPAVEREARERLGQAGLELPKGVTVGRLVQFAVPTVDAELPETLSPRAHQLLGTLRTRGPMPVTDLLAETHCTRSTLTRLVGHSLATLERRPLPLRDPFLDRPAKPDTPPELTGAQAQAVAVVTAALAAQTAQAFLLQGVTASGKTEVYLRAVAYALSQHRGAIVLVPEIALTPQLTARFRARLGDSVAVLHSGLTDGARHGMWLRLRRGDLRVAIGARSALFAPVASLGLVCVDEEHDGSFKQDEGVRYHARDMALLRAYRAGAVCVLGSATPSLESEMLVRSGKLQQLTLPQRARQKTALPPIEIVDLRCVGPGPTGDRRLSLLLFRELERVLARHEQVILFLNRRGFAPYLVCNGCGKVVECPTCSVGLAVHRAQGERVLCHYCGHTARVPTACPSCNGTQLELVGAGTEQIEEGLTRAFPGARVARLDRDVAPGAKSERVLERVRSGQVDILVGTQMVTKGHDLPGVTLVGVLDADAALSMPDFRASERTFQLLVQVAGRAGRGDSPGKVIIQTRNPEHPAIRSAVQHDLQGFMQRELADRAELGYPPCARLGLVRIDAVEESVAHAEAQRLARLVRAAAPRAARVVGPAPAPLARLRNRYRFHFMVRARDRTVLRAALLPVVRADSDRRVRVAIDVDPIHML